MKKRVLLWLTMLSGVIPVAAQYDASFANYWALPAYFNPAASGLSGQLEVRAAYSMQMMGFENAPSVMFAGVDLPLFFFGPKHGAGVGFLNDGLGLFSHKKFYLQYAFHQPLWGGRISGGLRAGFLSETFDGTKADPEESNDPAIPTSSVSGSGFDVDFGLRYTRKSWYVGFSMMHCTSPTVKLGDDKLNELSIAPVFYLTGGYNIKTKSPFYTIHTNAMLRTDGVAWRGDVTGRVAYNGSKYHLYGGLSYSPLNSVSFLAGCDFHGINIGYAYEMYTAGIGAASGSHELVISYQTDLNLFKKGKNKHKSVRIL
ncbi:MAG: PorP/SprF family type IX secretion system membrane protein [Clostridium sp.]|nr:PorP/SprF family type IX secretion system membrane protein [Clostridium sp.]